MTNPTTPTETQGTLFGPEPIRSSIPPHNGTSTSLAAAESLVGCVAGLRREVLRHIAECGDYGSTADELITALGMRSQTASARCTELCQMGFISRDGRKRPTSSGRAAFIYCATVKGLSLEGNGHE